MDPLPAAGGCWRPPSPSWPPHRGWRRGGRCGTSRRRAFPPPVLRYRWRCRTARRLIDALGTPMAYAARWLGLRLLLAGRSDAALRGPARPRAGRRWTSRRRPVLLAGRTLARLPDRRPACIKVPLAGGAPITICDSCTGFSFVWGSDDTVRYHAAPAGNVSTRVLMAVSAQGGRPHEFARPDSASGDAFRSPILLPGRRTVLFSIYRDAASRLAAIDLRTGAITRFDQPGFGPQWVDGGFVVLSNADGTLIALPFDPDRVRPTGPPVTIARDVAQPDAFTMRVAVSAGGSIVYPRSGGGVARRLVLVSRSGQATPLTPDPRGVREPALLPRRPAGRDRHRRSDHVQPRRVGARCRPARVVAPDDQRHQRSPDLDAGRAARGVLEQR